MADPHSTTTITMVAVTGVVILVAIGIHEILITGTTGTTNASNRSIMRLTACRSLGDGSLLLVQRLTRGPAHHQVHMADLNRAGPTIGTTTTAKVVVEGTSDHGLLTVAVIGTDVTMHHNLPFLKRTYML